MIFYGTRATNIFNGRINRVKCPNCETETNMTYSVFGKYTHIYWIPLFPYKKIGITECESCKHTFEAKELPDEIREKLKVEKERNNVKYPLWYFSGLFIIAILVLLGFYFSKQNDEENIEFINNPMVGDIYEYKTDSGYYSTLKISNVTTDSVYFFYNEMETNLKSGIEDIDIDKNYINEDGMTKSELKLFFEGEKIYEVNRK